MDSRSRHQGQYCKSLQPKAMASAWLTMTLLILCWQLPAAAISDTTSVTSQWPAQALDSVSIALRQGLESLQTAATLASKIAHHSNKLSSLLQSGRHLVTSRLISQGETPSSHGSSKSLPRSGSAEPYASTSPQSYPSSAQRRVPARGSRKAFAGGAGHGQRRFMQAQPGQTVYNVRQLGARGQDKSDDTYPFMAAFKKACFTPGGATVYVPPHFRFRVLPFQVRGPCLGPLTFWVDGSVVAPEKIKQWPNPPPQYWLFFNNITDLTIKGIGNLDGRGWEWWAASFKTNSNVNDCAAKGRGMMELKPKPNAGYSQTIKAVFIMNSRNVVVEDVIVRNSPLFNLVFFYCDGVTVSRVKGRGMMELKPKPNAGYSQTIKAVFIMNSRNVVVEDVIVRNSPLFNLVFFYCDGVTVSRVKVTAPGNSPNTDGIHIEQCNNVVVRDSVVGTGDDCISIQSGTSNVDIRNIICGPGHGISIGGLGRGDTFACVSNIHVQNVTFFGTSNGARIKTWPGSSGAAYNITFSDLKMVGVQQPVVIDQNYCDQRCPAACAGLKESNVQVHDVRFERVTGTATTSRGLYVQCSGGVPCIDIFLTNVTLQGLPAAAAARDAQGQLRAPLVNDCGSAYGTAKGVTPWKCLTDVVVLPGGRPPKQRPVCTDWLKTRGIAPPFPFKGVS
eukprot:jgi/Mesen1/2883/ME000175S02038